MFLYFVGSVGNIVHSSASGGVTRVCTIFHARVGPVWFLEKAHREMLRRTCVFAFGVICGLRSAFQCVRSAKCRCTIFHARVELVQFP
jgi:hypothetical protein